MAENTRSSLPPGIGTTTAQVLLDQPEIARCVRLLAGAESLSRVITHPRIQKSGLVLAGHTHGVVPTRVQIFGETELSYLESLEPETRRKRCRQLFELEISLVVVTRNVAPPAELIEEAEKARSPVVVSEPRSSVTIARFHRALDRLLAPTDTKHGVFIDVHGIGTLLLGPSGIGKSEVALFLVERGHRLIADDRVVLTREPGGAIVGRPPALLRHHLELRGLGIVNIRDLFGATAVRESHDVELIVELLPADSEVPIDRLGLDDEYQDVLGTQVPILRIPVQPGRNMAVLIEVAARNQLMKQGGHHAASAFVARLSTELGLPENEGGDPKLPDSPLDLRSPRFPRPSPVPPPPDED